MITVILIILLLVILLCIYFEDTTLRVIRYDINNKKIPSGFDKYKIMQISDFHSMKNNKLINDLINKIKEEKPNIIVITGDIISNSKSKNITSAIDFIKKINNSCPIYFVTGNHESRIDNYDKFKKLLIKNKVIVLENETKIIKKSNAQINLIGINDPSMFKERIIDDDIIIQNELIEANYNSDMFNLLLAHRPDLINVYLNNNIDLVLTGHTHGGQIRIPFMGAIYAPDQGLFPKYDSGIFEKDNMIMIVSSGIGTSVIPIRTFNKPELVIITLKGKRD